MSKGKKWCAREAVMIALRHLPNAEFKPVSISKLRDSVENYLHVAAAAVVTFVIILSVIHAISARFVPAPGTVTVKVRPGETLWTYATHYGNPDEYILKRVHKIATMNKLDASRPLEVGQKLIIPVERPTLSAKAETSVP
jgi:nucleoid-associated protein YgaU